MKRYSRMEVERFKIKWQEANRENRLGKELMEFKEQVTINVLNIMRNKCHGYNDKSLKIAEYLKDMKDPKKEKFTRMYMNVSRAYENEEWENCIKLAKKAIFIIKDDNFRNVRTLFDIYYMGIKASIFEEAPDIEMLNEGLAIADNAPELLLIKLSPLINELNEIKGMQDNCKELIDEIVGLGKESEAKMVEKYELEKNKAEMVDRMNDLYSSYTKFISICKRKNIEPNIIMGRSLKKGKEKSFFIIRDKVNGLDEMCKVDGPFINYDHIKLSYIKEMEIEMEGEWKESDYIIPRLTNRNRRNIIPGLNNLFDCLKKYQSQAKILNSDSDVDGRYLETFIAFVEYKLQKHIADKFGKKKVQDGVGSHPKCFEQEAAPKFASRS
jgi:hypothetical protein